MKIQGKIFFSLFFVVFLLVAMVFFSYRATKQVSYFRIRSEAAESQLLAITSFRAEVRNQVLESFNGLYVSGLKKYEARIELGKLRVQEKIKNVKENAASLDRGNDSFKIELEDTVHAYEELQNSLDQAVDLLKQGRFKEAQAISIDAHENKFKNSFLKKITEMIQKEQVISKLESSHLEESIGWLQKVLFFSAFIAILFSIYLSMFLAHSIGRRLAKIEKVAQKISNGDFQVEVPVEGNDEVSTLSVAINKMAASLQEAKKQISKQQELLVISSKMSSLGEMAGGIAHEINTPLAVISLKTALLKDAALSEAFIHTGQKLVIETCDIVDRTVHRIAKIITGLRAFAREGASDPFQNTEIQAIVKDTLDLCSEKFYSSGVELHVHAPQEPVMLKCRGIQISQVLLNLLNNSYDAVQPLKEKWVNIDVVDFGEKVAISVTDSGSGISPAIREKLAQPFFTTKDVGKGTGLGLSISRGIIMDHGGEFSLDEQCANTRFQVLLPKDPLTVKRKTIF